MASLSTSFGIPLGQLLSIRSPASSRDRSSYKILEIHRQIERNDNNGFLNQPRGNANEKN